MDKVAECCQIRIFIGLVFIVIEAREDGESWHSSLKAGPNDVDETRILSQTLIFKGYSSVDGCQALCMHMFWFIPTLSDPD